jgi:ubiquitin-protein ligase
MPQYQVYFDTLEGERRYDVDIGENESLEQVLRDVLVELSERGHVMRGISTGDLKVIWGGREGRELDLSRTLDEQGVRPNDVLRVLVEIYEGGGRGLRADRVEKEWALLDRLAAANPEYIEVIGRTPSAVEDVFHVRLHSSPGIARVHGETLETRDSHTFRFCFTRFYPEVPVDCYVAEPLFHPNVNPESGFVCLWEQANPRETVVQALARTQAIAAFRMVNTGAPHLMNKDAAAWYERVAKPRQLVPLTWSELKVYEVREGQLVWIDPARQPRTAPRVRLV